MSPKNQKGDDSIVLVTNERSDKGLLLYDLDDKNKKGELLANADLFVRYIESENELYFIEELPKKSKEEALKKKGKT